jgi:hypothetical protein
VLSEPEPAARPLPAESATASPEPSPVASVGTTPVVPPGPSPEVAVKTLPEPIESLKHLIDSIPNGKVGRTILRWVKPDREKESSRSTPDR